MPTLAEVLVEARNNKHWSLRDAERETGIHNAHLVQIEKGTIARPSPTLLLALSDSYGVGFDLLMKLAGHTHQDTSHRLGAALRALNGLTPEKQDEAVEFLIRLQREEGNANSSQ
jgi:transcriptional regulator with XRE-family HTH domain